MERTLPTGTKSSTGSTLRSPRTSQLAHDDQPISKHELRRLRQFTGPVCSRSSDTGNDEDRIGLIAASGRLAFAVEVSPCGLGAAAVQVRPSSTGGHGHGPMIHPTEPSKLHAGHVPVIPDNAFLTRLG